MGSVSLKKTFILSLCVAAIVHILHCNSYPANDVWMSKKKDDNIFQRFTVEQEDNSAPKQSSFCQMGNVSDSCGWPETSCSTNGYRITFSPPFDEEPIVMVAINGLDMDRNFNSRLKVFSKEITATGFTLVVETWADTRLYNVGASCRTACSSRETPCRR